MRRHSTSVSPDTRPETLRVFDRHGRFVARATLGELERTVAAHRLVEGWTLAGDSDLWQPLAVSLARARQATQSPSGVYAKNDLTPARKTG